MTIIILLNTIILIQKNFNRCWIIAGSDDGAYNEPPDVGYIQMGDLA